jgi:ubiquinol-cytochrome c reductase cytochrome b subunit
MPVDRRTHQPLGDRITARWAASSPGALVHTLTDRARRRPTSLHWTSLFGVAVATAATVFIGTGLLTMLVFVPSSDPTLYAGAYAPLVGRTVSKAYASELHLAFDIPGGMLVRQLHHWSMQLLPVAIIMQMLAVFFTGGFRKPRRTNWVLLYATLLIALIGGWSGYGLPDDMLSGSGLRIVEGITVSLPFIGTWASSILFGGAFPGRIIEHLALIHFIVVPAALIAVLLLRAAISWVQGPAQFPAPGRSETTVVGVPLYPAGIARIAGFFVSVVGLLTLISATVTINPVWTYGPSDPGNATAGSQPDWYTGFLDGALRLVPPGWEIVIGGYTWTLALLVPLAVIGLFLLAVLLYPFLEQWVANDAQPHHLLQRPRDTPTRTALGAGAMTFYGALWNAGSADVAAHQLGLAFEQLIHAGQFLVVVGPFLAFTITKRVCLALQRKDREALLHGYETGRIVRRPWGEYTEIHAPISQEDSWRILHAERPTTFALRPRPDGRIALSDRLKGRLNRFFFEDRLVALPTSSAPELETAHPTSAAAEVDASESTGH